MDELEGENGSEKLEVGGENSESLNSREKDQNISPQDQEYPTSNLKTSNNVPTSGIYASTPSDGPKSSKLALIIPVILILAVFGGAIYFRSEIMSKIKQFNAPKEVPNTTIEPTPTPTPTPIPVERGQYKVRVLNGTTTAGLAGKLADKLKGLGWLIDKTGNNSDQTVEESIIRAKPNIPDFVIEGMMGDITDYQAGSSSAALKTTDKADLEIVIGKK